MTNIKLCLKKIKAHSGIELSEYVELIKVYNRNIDQTIFKDCFLFVLY